MLSNVVRRFVALSPAYKLLVLLVVTVIAVLLSPFVTTLATLVFFVALVALVIRLLRGRPLRTWGITAAASLVLVVLASGVSGALYGTDAAQDDATTSKPRDTQAVAERDSADAGKTAKPEAAAKESKPEEPGSEESEQAKTQAPEEAAKPDEKENAKDDPAPAATPAEKDNGQAEEVAKRPPTVEEKLRSEVEKVFVYPKKEIRSLSAPQQTQAGCRNVTVEFYEQNAEFMELTMQDIYKAIYGDEQLSQAVCTVTASAYGELQNDYGQSWKKNVYSTSMNDTTANKINWKEDYMVNFPNVWTVNYMHPSVRQQKAQARVEKAVDCAEDKGLFDVDIDCP